MTILKLRFPIDFRRGLAAFWEGGRTFQRCVAMLATASPATFTAYVVALVINGVLPVLQTWLLKLVVDGVTIKSGIHFDARVFFLAVLYASTFVVLYGLEPLEGALIASLQSYATAEVDRRLITAGAKLVDLGMIERAKFQDDLHLLQQAAFRSAWMLRRLRNGSVTILTLCGLLLLLWYLQPWFAAIMVIACVPHVWAEIYHAGKVYQALSDQSRVGREIDYIVKISTDPLAAKEIRVFGMGNFFLQRFRTKRDQALSEMLKVRLAHIGNSVMCASFYIIALGFGFWYVATQVSARYLASGDIALYLGAVLQIQQCLYILALFIGELHAELSGMGGLFRFQEQAQPCIALAANGHGQTAPTRFQSGVDLQQVSFVYPGTDQRVLQEISAHLTPGTITALVGENGAGKSTLVKLLTRMYDPTAGAIYLDGNELVTYDLVSLRGQMATVYQDFARFGLTLRENIAVGSLTNNRDHVDVEVAAHWSGADEVAAKLARGYETPLTRQFEHGVDLSGGEWQKIALARGFIRGTNLVILDEPTSALDAEAERRLMDKFRMLVANKVGLLISHRFSSVRLADQILFLENGRIIEAGAHKDLLTLGGRYAAWYEMQAERYRDTLV